MIHTTYKESLVGFWTMMEILVISPKSGVLAWMQMDGLEEHETQNLERARALQAHMSIGGAPAPPYWTEPK